jgi:hypothetical protein
MNSIEIGMNIKWETPNKRIERIGKVVDVMGDRWVLVHVNRKGTYYVKPEHIKGVVE